MHELCTTDTVGLREVSSTSVVRLQDGDHFDLHIAPVRKPLSHIKGFVSTLRRTDVEWDAETR
jgi:hypothetical protein